MLKYVIKYDIKRLVGKMKNNKGSKLKRMFSSLKKRFNESIYLSLLKYIVFFALFALIGLFGISYVIDLSIPCILQINEVLAVVIIALPTVIVWIFDINNKNIQNKSENLNMYFDIQNSLEEKYTKLKDEVKEFLEKEDLKMIFE